MHLNMTSKIYVNYLKKGKDTSHSAKLRQALGDISLALDCFTVYNNNDDYIMLLYTASLACVNVGFNFQHI